MSSFCCSLNLCFMSENAKRRNLLTEKSPAGYIFGERMQETCKTKKTKLESITSWHRSFFPRWLQILLGLKPLEDFSSNLRPCWHQKCNGIASSATTRSSRSDDVIGTSGRFPVFHGHSQFTGSNSTTQSLASSLSGFLSGCQSRSLGCRLNWMSIPPFHWKVMLEISWWRTLRRSSQVSSWIGIDRVWQRLRSLRHYSTTSRRFGWDTFGPGMSRGPAEAQPTKPQLAPLGPRTNTGTQEAGHAPAGPVQVFHQMGFSQNLEPQNPFKIPCSRKKSPRIAFLISFLNQNVHYKSTTTPWSLAAFVGTAILPGSDSSAFKTGNEFGNTSSPQYTFGWWVTFSVPMVHAVNVHTNDWRSCCFDVFKTAKRKNAQEHLHRNRVPHAG